ncbi:hypothetical protein D3C84_1156410 [compost metagenome]
MLVVLIQGVDHAGAQVVLLAVGNGFDGAVAFNAPHRFKMVLVVDVRAAARKNGGLVEGKAHAVLLQQHAAADPGIGADFVGGADDIFDIAYDH